MPVDRFDRRSGAGRKLGWVGEASTWRDRRHQLAVNQMLAAHLVDRQEAHQCAAREPDQQLRTNKQRQPFVQAAGKQMNALFASQNQNLIAATKLTAFGFSPAKRAYRAVSPVLPDHSTPM